MKSKKKLNVKLLEKISEHILAVPERVNMQLGLDVDSDAYKHECHTVGCIAGWAVALKKKQGYLDTTCWGYEWSSIQSQARELLGIPKGQEDELFLPDAWPERFAYRLADQNIGTKGYARVVVARIRDYIKQYGPKEGGSKKRKEKAA